MIFQKGTKRMHAQARTYDTETSTLITFVPRACDGIGLMDVEAMEGPINTLSIEAKETSEIGVWSFLGCTMAAFTLKAFDFAFGKRSLLLKLTFQSDFGSVVMLVCLVVVFKSYSVKLCFVDVVGADAAL